MLSVIIKLSVIIDRLSVICYQLLSLLSVIINKVPDNYELLIIINKLSDNYLLLLINYINMQLIISMNNEWDSFFFFSRIDKIANL